MRLEVDVMCGMMMLRDEWRREGGMSGGSGQGWRERRDIKSHRLFFKKKQSRTRGSPNNRQKVPKIKTFSHAKARENNIFDKYHAFLSCEVPNPKAHPLPFSP